MSKFAIVPAQVFEDEGLNSNERLTLCVLFLHMDREAQTCYPSIKRICRLSGLSERTVRRSIGSLRAKGHLAVTHRKTASGDFNSNLYTLRGWGQCGSTPSHSDRGGGASVAVGGATEATKQYHITAPVKQTTEHPGGEGERNLTFNPEDDETILTSKEKERLIDALFGDFWAAYPRRVAKKTAFKAFHEVFAGVRTMADAAIIIENMGAHLLRYTSELEGSGTPEKFIAFAATWLNRSDFTEPPPPPKSERPQFEIIHDGEAQNDDDGASLLEHEKG